MCGYGSDTVQKFAWRNWVKSRWGQKTEVLTTVQHLPATKTMLRLTVSTTQQ